MKKIALLFIATLALIQTPQTFAFPLDDSLNEYRRLIEEISSTFHDKFPENERIIHISRDAENSFDDEPSKVRYFIYTTVEKRNEEEASLEFTDIDQNDRVSSQNPMSRIYIAHLTIYPSSSTEPAHIEVDRLVSLNDMM